MTARLLSRLIGIDPRMLLAGIGLLFALVGFESWMLVLRAPLAERAALVRARAALHTAVQNTGSGAAIAADIARLTAENDANARALAADAPIRADSDTVLALIDSLGRIARRHDVALGSVKTGRRSAVSGVEEQSYDVEARGDYLALHAWLSDARREFAPLVVGDLTLKSIDNGRRVAMTLRLAAYRLAGAARSAP